MKIPDYRKGTTFECQCAHTGRTIDDKPYFDSFGISEQHAMIFGRKAENIVTVRGTIIEEDVNVEGLLRNPSYDENAHDYFGWIDFEDDESYNIRLIYGNIKSYFICFPGGPDSRRFYSTDVMDYNTEKIIHKAGDRRGMSVRLSFELI